MINNINPNIRSQRTINQFTQLPKQQSKTKRRYSIPTDFPGDAKKHVNSNQIIIEQYKTYIEKNPNLLPNSEVFDQINKIYLLWMFNAAKSFLFKRCFSILRLPISIFIR